MNKLLISYDLIQPHKDYNELYDFIRSLGKWAKPLESLWVVVTDKSHKVVRDELKNHVDENDKLFVVDITGKASAWFNLPKEVSEWLRNN